MVGSILLQAADACIIYKVWTTVDEDTALYMPGNLLRDRVWFPLFLSVFAGYAGGGLFPLTFAALSQVSQSLNTSSELLHKSNCSLWSIDFDRYLYIKSTCHTARAQVMHIHKYVRENEPSLWLQSTYK